MNEHNYTYEEHLVNDFISIIPKYFSCKYEIKIKKELSVGNSIADIVILLKTEKYIEFDHIILNTTESVIVAYLRKKGNSRIDILEKNCRVKNNEFRKGKLKRLFESGIIIKGKGGQIALSPEWNKNIRLIAIEAKISDWKKALLQATSYKKYADEVFVLLPNVKIKNIKEDIFIKNGVGLISLSKNKINTIVDAEQNRDHDWRREFALSRVINLQ